MEKWEYDVQPAPFWGAGGEKLIAILNERGQDGWELVSILEHSSGYVFKRRLE
jgi:hypothetical protein